MPRGIDHIVHAARDLDAAATLYRQLGFTVGARNRHPWGTHNHIVQLPGFFIELLTVAEPDKLGTDGFSTLFGAFNRDFLSHNEGLSLLILESHDAVADAAAFANAGIAQSDAMRFDREASRPDGTKVKVGFSLAFVDTDRAPMIRFATCQQHFPENFWNPAFQQHANGAQSVTGIAIVTGKPVEYRSLVSTFTGVSDLRSSANVVVARTPRGEVAVMDPVSFRGAFGSGAPPVNAGGRLAAVRLAVGDLQVTEDLLGKSNIAFTCSGKQLVIGAAAAMGATIAFEQAGNSVR
jgi:hypothetical protein